MSRVGRQRKVAALSTALPSIVSAMSTSGMKAAPPKPTGQKMVSCHTGEKENGRLVKFKDAPAWFRPVLTPREMLLKGMHGGIYFNPKGGKPGVKYPRNKYPNGIPGVTIDEYPDKWFKGVPKELYASRRYDHKRNAYGVKSGLDQVGWETSGWINQCDPRGWTQVCVRVCDSKALSSLVSDFSHTRLFSSLSLACAQWYFRFYMGRRLSGGEDERQMGRWNGVCGEKGRWKQNLIAKCMRDNKAHDDPTVSPVVRQTLLHWAYELSEADFGHGAKRVKTHGAAYVPIDSLKGVVSGKNKKRSGADEEEEDGDEGSSSAVMKAEQDEERVKRAEKRRAAATADPATSARPAKRAKQPASEKKEGKKAVKKEVQGSPPRLSEYERKRDEQKKKNQRKLEELGLA